MLNYETNGFILIILYILSNCKLILAQINRSALQTECGGAFASLRQRMKAVSPSGFSMHFTALSGDSVLTTSNVCKSA